MSILPDLGSLFIMQNLKTLVNIGRCRLILVMPLFWFCHMVARMSWELLGHDVTVFYNWILGFKFFLHKNYRDFKLLKEISGMK